MLNKLKAVRDKILKMHEVREGNFYYYTSFKGFVSMCQGAYSKKQEAESVNPSLSSRPFYPDFFCFDADTFNDPREGKVLLELSEHSGNDSLRGLLSKVYKDDEIDKKPFSPPQVVFVGCLVSDRVGDLTIWGKKSLKKNIDYDYIDDQLPMWRDYADKGKGVCLGVKIKSSDGIPVYRVSYDERDQLMAIDAICSVLRDINPANIAKFGLEIREVIDPIRFLYKSKEHSYENEARVIIPCSLKKGRCKYSIELFKKDPSDPTSYRLYIALKDFFFKNGGTITVGPAFDESDYIFNKMVIVKQVHYWLEKLNLSGKVEVSTSRYSIRF
ncbi:hypothetical protein TTHT_1035 [Thermotomaculum hydrothermale]|uniref:Uncharacterized protein n=1 Tax=Thermotomaculum hydrothermale TaxID=981385 RepID=A0A7R6PH96_9BACT|nr:DUF2971 domain-containing protein [Thermotomaculum hydrothermale]BBB32574.1 hypothetical protein TTHT_1035 [Thermotomaculum hydrothermale]